MRGYGLILLVLMAAGTAAFAQGKVYKFGKVPTEAEIKAVDTLVDQDGKLMPQGQGTVAEGAAIYAQRCAMCHGPNGEGTDTPAGQGPVLVAQDKQSTRAIRGYHFATTLFSYIHRAMPLHQERTLTVDQAYSLTAFLLHRNGIIGENEVLDAESLPRVKMPNHDEWVQKPPSDKSG